MKVRLGSGMMRLVVAVPAAALLLSGCRSSTADLVARADSRTAVIDSQVALLTGDTASVFGLSAEGAFLEAHYQQDSLRRLRVLLYGELGRSTETYYFDAALFLVVRTDEHYDAPLSGRVRDSISNRIYVDSGAVVRWTQVPGASPTLDAAAARRAADSLTAGAESLVARVPRRKPGLRLEP